MNILKTMTAITVIMLSFSNCSSSKDLQRSVPFTIGESYYQHDKKDASVINLYVSVTSNPVNIALDSAYFNNQQSKLELAENNLLVARFKTATTKNTDIIMSSDPHAEYGNKAPVLAKKSLFQLKENECVISFKKGNKTKYFKIEGLTKK